MKAKKTVRPAAKQKVGVFLNLAGLKARGWTDATIKKILGPPDRSAANPHYRNAAPQRLYLLSRVEKAEAARETRMAFETSRRRSACREKAAQVQRQALVAEAEQTKVEVTKLSAERLLKLSIASYNDKHDEFDIEWTPASPQSEPDFLQRIQVNYIRHELTLYDHMLQGMVGRVGVRQAVRAIREKVYAEIAATYPYLEEACRRQLQRRQEQEKMIGEYMAQRASELAQARK